MGELIVLPVCHAAWTHERWLWVRENWRRQKGWRNQSAEDLPDPRKVCTDPRTRAATTSEHVQMLRDMLSRRSA
jgi:hypothetical protein